MEATRSIKEAAPRRRFPRRSGHSLTLTEDVEVAQRTFGALNRSFAEGGEEYVDLLDADVEWIPITSLLDGRTYRGREAVRRWLEDVRQVWRAYRITWNHVRDLGGGRVLAFGVWDCVGRRAGVEMSFDHGAWLMDVRGGRMIRLEAFADRAEALAAAGLAA